MPAAPQRPGERDDGMDVARAASGGDQHAHVTPRWPYSPATGAGTFGRVNCITPSSRGALRNIFLSLA